ncbi:MAG: hypothetical protein RBR02_10940 [Desulfuromonadaceae bacterium]|nr:hypothetical protein [Desulfuromonadaceae bacterium]
MKKDNSYTFLGATYPISKRSFYLRLMGVVCVFVVLLGVTFWGLSFMFDKKNNSDIKIKNLMQEKHDYLFRIKEDIVRFSILKDEKDIEKVKKILEDSLNRNKELIQKYEEN